MNVQAFVKKWSESGAAERDAILLHEGQKTSVGRMDLYKAGHFILEAKQGSDEGAAKKGTAKRGTAAWNLAMHDAFGQAVGYARTLERPPPFIVTTDIGHCFELFAAFDGTGRYSQFPDVKHHGSATSSGTSGPTAATRSRPSRCSTTSGTSSAGTPSSPGTGRSWSATRRGSRSPAGTAAP